MRRRRCGKRLDVVRDLPDGLSDNDGMGGPHRQLLRVQVFPTVTINGIINAKRLEHPLRENILPYSIVFTDVNENLGCSYNRGSDALGFFISVGLLALLRCLFNLGESKSQKPPFCLQVE
jgi:hypothetical protein